jgi:hypothetical protein
MLRSAAALESELRRKRVDMEDNKMDLQRAGCEARPEKLPADNIGRKAPKTAPRSLI